MQKSISPAPADHWSQRPFLRTREAAALLAVSRATIYNLEKAGKLRFVNIGQRRLVDTSTLVLYVASLRAGATTQEVRS